MEPVDWKEIREWLSPIIAFVSMIIALFATVKAKKATKSKQEFQDKYFTIQQQYVKLAEIIGEKSQMLSYLQRMEDASKYLQKMEDDMSRLGEKTIDIVTNATTNIEKSVKHFSKLTAQMETIGNELRKISSSTLTTIKRENKDNKE